MDHLVDPVLIWIGLEQQKYILKYVKTIKKLLVSVEKYYALFLVKKLKENAVNE